MIRSSCLRSRKYWIFGQCIRRRRRFLGLYELGDGGAWAGERGFREGKGLEGFGGIYYLCFERTHLYFNELSYVI